MGVRAAFQATKHTGITTKMPPPSIFRSAHLHLFLDTLRESGVPVTQLVQLSRLPSWVEEIEEAYVSLPRSLECLASMCQGAELMELGQKAAARLSLATLSPPFLQALMQAPSGLHRIDILTWACALEYSDLRIQLVPEGSQLRIQCNCPGLRGNPFFALTEWPILAMVIATLRSALGDQWAPSEVTLRSRGKPCTAATTAFGAPRILTEQPHCSLVVDGAALQACAAPRPVSLPLQPGPVAQPLRFRGWAFVPAFRELVRPYLADGYPELPQMAALMGISTRTLQRRLQASGQSYSRWCRTFASKWPVTCCVIQACACSMWPMRPDTRVRSIFPGRSVARPE